MENNNKKGINKGVWEPDSSDILDIKPIKTNTTEEKKPVESPISETGDNRGFNSKAELEKLEEIRNWIMTNKDADWNVSRFKLDKKISEYELNVTEIVDGFKKEGLISYSDIIGAWRVTNTSQEKKPKKYTKDEEVER